MAYSVQEIFGNLRANELKPLSIKDKDEVVLLNYLNLALSSIYRKFNVKTKAEVIRLTKATTFYTLQNTDILKVLEVYDSKGNAVRERSVHGDTEYRYTALGGMSYLINNPLEDEELVFTYQAGPKKVTDLDSVLDLPDCFIEALQSYIAYKAFGSIRTVTTNGSASDSAFYIKRYEELCVELLLSGYGAEPSIMSIDVATKGYV